MQEEVEKARKEASERKFKDRQVAAKQATRGGRAKDIEEDDEGPPRTEFRSNSPPVPSLRGKKPQQDEVVSQLSNMRDQLDRKQQEHNEVWNGLVEV